MKNKESKKSKEPKEDNLYYVETGDSITVFSNEDNLYVSKIKHRALKKKPLKKFRYE